MPLFRLDYHARLRAQGLGRLPGADVDWSGEMHLNRLDLVLGGRNSLVGDTTSIADIAVAAQLVEIIRTSARQDRIRARPKVSR
jgi:glutathione S-transferase